MISNVGVSFKNSLLKIKKLKSIQKPKPTEMKSNETAKSKATARGYF